MRSYGELRVKEDQQARDTCIERKLKELGAIVEMHRMNHDEVMWTIISNLVLDTGSALETALFMWIEQLLG
jgi:hypothetical protein